MTIQGLTKGPCVFGIYGPSNSREVLTDILTGSGYNFVLVSGASDSTPRELLLTPITTASSDVASREAVRNDSVPPELYPTASEERGPGAVFPAPPQAPQDEGNRIQQKLQRLQHLQEPRIHYISGIHMNEGGARASMNVGGFFLDADFILSIAFFGDIFYILQ